MSFIPTPEGEVFNFEFGYAGNAARDDEFVSLFRVLTNPLSLFSIVFFHLMFFILSFAFFLGCFLSLVFTSFIYPRLVFLPHCCFRHQYQAV
jgi:hypothetical protein